MLDILYYCSMTLEFCVADVRSLIRVISVVVALHIHAHIDTKIHARVIVASFRSLSQDYNEGNTVEAFQKAE